MYLLHLTSPWLHYGHYFASTCADIGISHYFGTGAKMGHVLIWGFTYDIQFQHWVPSSGTGGPVPELAVLQNHFEPSSRTGTPSSRTGTPSSRTGCPKLAQCLFGDVMVPVPELGPSAGTRTVQNKVQHIYTWDVYVSTQIVTDPVLKLDPIFHLVSKLERFWSQIVTVPIWDVQFQNWMSSFETGTETWNPKSSLVPYCHWWRFGMMQYVPKSSLVMIWEHLITSICH